MLSSRWRLCALTGVLASPLMARAKEIDIRFTNFERPSLEVGSEGEPWDPLITRIVEPIRGTDGLPRLFGGSGDWLGEHFGTFGKTWGNGRRQGFVIPETNREAFIVR